MMCWRTLLFAAVLVSASVATSGAADSDPEKRLIANIGVDEITPGMTKAIADMALPSTYDVKAGETLGALIRRHCGRDDENFLRLVKERARLLGLKENDVSTGYVFTNARSVELPHCLRAVDGTGESGRLEPSHAPFDTKWARGWKTFDDASATIQSGLVCKEMNGTTFCNASPAGWNPQQRAGPDKKVEFEQKWAYDLSPFDEWDYDGWDYGVPVKKQHASNPQWVIPIRPGVTPKQALAALNHELPPEAAAREEQDGIVHDTVLSNDKDTCLTPSDSIKPENYPVDAYEILRVLGLNRTVRKVNAGSAFPIVIGDSGLYLDMVDGPFPRRSVEGVNSARMRPNEDYLHRQHGTYVATAALGGPYFMRFLSLLNSPPALHPHNIISKTLGCHASPLGKDFCTVEDAKLTALVSGGGTGAIVNLSVSHNGALLGVEKELSSASAADKFLVVAAAGNTAKAIQTGTFPQMLAQNATLKKYMIVVAALESNGKKLAPESSYHSDWVELAAYGCKVPVYEFNKNEGRYAIVPKSGTSMAAPLVSFAAALLQGQTALSPAIIKKRLLISADYEPDLKRRVKNNAKLNIARSLALFHDVVQLKGGRPIYGRLNGDNFTIAVCGGTPLTRRELRSISVYKTPAASKIFVYHGVTGDQDKPDNSLEQKDCDLGAPNPYNPEDILADMEFEIENAETGIPHKFRMGDVSNITFAHAPYWEN